MTKVDEKERDKSKEINGQNEAESVECLKIEILLYYMSYYVVRRYCKHFCQVNQEEEEVCQAIEPPSPLSLPFISADRKKEEGRQPLFLSLFDGRDRCCHPSAMSGAKRFFQAKKNMPMI